MNRPKAIGTAAESATVRYLQANGFDNAERRALRGTADAGDITGTPGLCWSVKGGKAAENASDLDIDRWLSELATQVAHAGARHGILVLKRRAVGPGNAGNWWAVLTSGNLTWLTTRCAIGPQRIPIRMRLADAVILLRWAGYGTPLQSEVDGAA